MNHGIIWECETISKVVTDKEEKCKIVRKKNVKKCKKRNEMKWIGKE